MSLRISNSNAFFRGQFAFNKIATQLLGTGVIMRIAGLNEESSSFTYTAIDNTTQQTPNLNTGSAPYYVVALSGSVSSQDTVVTNFISSTDLLAVTNTLITGSTTGSAFTEELITTPGSGNWTKPTGVTQVIVECWGGGGAGGGTTVNDWGGGGGAGGQYARKLIIYPTASQSIPYAVAASVAGGTGDGSTGNDTTWDTSVVVAKGGQGGIQGQIGSSNGGTGSINGGVGDVVYGGGNGGIGSFNSPLFALAGNGGGGAGSTGQPGDFISPGWEYGGQNALGDQISSGGVNGNPGNNYGGGGGGAAKISGPNRSGGAGAQGLIRIIYR